MAKKVIPWLDKEERRRMELIRSDLRRQAERHTEAGNMAKVRELETQINTLSRELAFDRES